MHQALLHKGAATDGTDLGADIDAIETAINGGTSSSTSLPSPWLNQDIGSPGASGSASYSSGTFTINGSGADIYAPPDEFHFVYQSLSGDGQIIARVASQQFTSSGAMAGVIISETLGADAKHVLLALSPNGGGEVNFETRHSTGGGSTWLAGVSGAPVPYWLKLVRNGNIFSAYSSANGTSWSLVGTDTNAMASTAYIGLAVCSHNHAVLNSSTFDNVGVIP